MADEYGTFPDGEGERETTPLLSVEAGDYVVQIEKPADATEPTLEPVGTRRKRNAQVQYNPHSWTQTLWSVQGRTYVNRAFVVVGLIGTALVVVSGVAGIGLEDDRDCRAWCSRFALGTQPHSYLGFILFLLMAFRTQQAYRLYFTGLTAQYRIKVALLRFAESLLHKSSRDAVPHAKRARMIAHAIALPYAIVADLRRERTFDSGTVEEVLDTEDLTDIVNAPSMPLYILDLLSTMVRKYTADCPPSAVRGMHFALDSVYQPYLDCEMVRESPCAFAYVAHLRLLLIIYLVTLPLALVEQLGFQTIPVFWVIVYCLMSLEMLAVEVENPFGHGFSDLRLFEYNLQIREALTECWQRWCAGLDDKLDDEARVENYEQFGSCVPVPSFKVHNAKWSYW